VQGPEFNPQFCQEKKKEKNQDKKCLQIRERVVGGLVVVRKLFAHPLNLLNFEPSKCVNH
jgi:hypothetical protein